MQDSVRIRKNSASKCAQKKTNLCAKDQAPTKTFVVLFATVNQLMIYTIAKVVTNTKTMISKRWKNVVALNTMNQYAD